LKGVKIKMKNKTKIQDVFNGELVSVWTDDEFVTLHMGLSTIALPIEEFDSFKEDIKNLYNSLYDL
jgi:hypothetical protein